MFEYCKVVCNFLNNTKGMICDYELKFLLENIFTDYDFTENDMRLVSEDDYKNLDTIIELDQSDKFYEEVYFIGKKIIKNHTI